MPDGLPSGVGSRLRRGAVRPSSEEAIGNAVEAGKLELCDFSRVLEVDSTDSAKSGEGEECVILESTSRQQKEVKIHNQENKVITRVQSYLEK